MFFRLLANSLARRLSRKLLAAFAVWIGISLILAFLAVSIDVGDKIRITVPSGPATITVAGIASTGGREDDAIILPLVAAQALAGVKGKYSEVDISALTTPENKLAEKYRQDPKSLTPAEYERWFCTPYPGSVAAEIQKSVPGSAARVVRKVSETQGAILTRIEGLMFLLAMLTLAACCLSVAGVLSSAVLERRAEVALMQAIGASRESVLLLFLGEGAVLGLAGGLFAAATGSFLGQWLVRAVFGSEPELHPALAVLSPLLGLMIVLAGSIWPVWQALHQDTAAVLHGN